jgi:hypothetical protein
MCPSHGSLEEILARLWSLSKLVSHREEKNSDTAVNKLGQE